MNLTEQFARQLGIADPTKLQIPITIVGAGAIGSHVTVALAKMGCRNLTVWDPDTVEAHNLPNQLFLHSLGESPTLGTSKVAVLAATVRVLASVDITPIQARLPKAVMLEGIVISGVDSMSARADIWETVKSQTEVTRYLDGRMGGQVGRLLHVNPTVESERTWYATTLCSDEEAAELPCTERSICYTQFGLSAMVSSIVRQQCVEGQVTVLRDLTCDFQHGFIAPTSAVGSLMATCLA